MHVGEGRGASGRQSRTLMSLGTLPPQDGTGPVATPQLAQGGQSRPIAGVALRTAHCLSPGLPRSGWLTPGPSGSNGGEGGERQGQVSVWVCRAALEEVRDAGGRSWWAQELPGSLMGKAEALSSEVSSPRGETVPTVQWLLPRDMSQSCHRHSADLG